MKSQTIITQKQQKRLGELILRDLQMDTQANVCIPNRVGRLNPTVNVNIPMPNIAIPDDSCSMEDMLNSLEQKQQERSKSLEQEINRRVINIFNREELFRFAYVPFVIAELVWDYADTVIIMSRQIDAPAVRRLSRVIRKARAEYDHLRRKFIDNENRKREIENGYVFENATKEITAQLMLNIRLDINTEYPDLDDDSRGLLLAVYQCHIISRALIRYLNKMTEKAIDRVGHPIGRILPPSYYLMDRLILEYVGNKPASPRFQKLMREYIDTYANQIALVKLSDTDIGEAEQPSRFVV